MNNPKSIRKSNEELKTNFSQAFGFLEKSLNDFANGHEHEAIRIAAMVYIFVHDNGKKTVSLLQHFNRKDIAFFNTARPVDPRNLLTEHPLVVLQIGPQSQKALPLFISESIHAYPPLPFSKWWEAPVLRDNRRRLFSRKNLVFTMRNKLGGGHVSSDIDEAFADLNRKNSMGWHKGSNSNSGIPLLGFEFATVAQIGHELRTTLKQNCAELLS